MLSYTCANIHLLRINLWQFYYIIVFTRLISIIHQLQSLNFAFILLLLVLLFIYLSLRFGFVIISYKHC